MSHYRVTAPYVTLKVQDANGQEVLLGFYEGGIVTDPTDDAQVRAHLDLGLLEEASADDQPEADPKLTGNKSELDTSGADASNAGSGEPAKTASKGDWVDYAVTQGANRGEAEASTKDQLIEAYGS